jgi:hypothetical protein
MFEAMTSRSSGLKSRITRLCAIGLGVGSLLGGVAVLGTGAPAGAATNLYVSSYGSDSGGNPCTNKADPCLTLQHAYNESAAGNTINLAGGTYKGGEIISHSVNIVGPSSDGSLDVNTATISRGGGTFDYVLTIEGGTVNISDVVVNGANGIGGGIAIDPPSVVTLNDVNVVNNIANQYEGAGIENDDVLVMNGGSIANNTDQGSFGVSGGLYTQDKATLNGVSLTHDVATSEGGAIFLDAGTLKLTGATPIHNNSAGVTGGGIEKCSGSTLQTVGSGISDTANTPNNFSNVDPAADC